MTSVHPLLMQTGESAQIEEVQTSVEKLSTEDACDIVKPDVKQKKTSKAQKRRVSLVRY